MSPASPYPPVYRTGYPDPGPLEAAETAGIPFAQFGEIAVRKGLHRPTEEETSKFRRDRWLAVDSPTSSYVLIADDCAIIAIGRPAPEGVSIFVFRQFEKARYPTTVDPQEIESILDAAIEGP